MDSRRIAAWFRIRSGGVADYIWRKLATPRDSPLNVGARRELLARFKAVLRRAGAKAEAKTGEAEGAPVSEARFADCRLDLDARKLFDADGGEIPITSMEFDLLKAFAEHPNRVLGRDQLVDMVHNRDWEPFYRSIDIRIARLRRKVEQGPAKPQIIKTVHGAGHLFARDWG